MSHKKGRPSQRPAAVPEVETVACPSGGNHRLVNTPAAHTRCKGCGQDWAVLDGQARGA